MAPLCASTFWHQFSLRRDLTSLLRLAFGCPKEGVLLASGCPKYGIALSTNALHNFSKYKAVLSAILAQTVLSKYRILRAPNTNTEHMNPNGGGCPGPSAPPVPTQDPDPEGPTQES